MSRGAAGGALFDILCHQVLGLSILLQISLSISAAEPALLELVRCARELNYITMGTALRGPVFVEDDIVLIPSRHEFGPSQRSKVLWVFTERSTHLFEVGDRGGNIAFRIPNVDPRLKEQVISLQLISNLFINAYQDFRSSSDRASKAHRWLKAYGIRSAVAERELSRTLKGQLESLLAAVLGGQLARGDLNHGNLSFCRGVESYADSTARLERLIDHLEALSPSENPQRLPASVGN